MERKSVHQGLGIHQLWQQGLDGSGVHIGLLDTGICPHDALADKISAFKVINDEDQLVESIPKDYNIGHGTEMATILCGEGPNYNGIAPRAKLLSARTLNTHKDILHTLIGLEWLGQQNCRVICMPMGLKGYNPIFESMLASLVKKGKLVVCPIGNDGVLNYRFPAVSTNVLSVGALDQKLQIPNFSGTLWDRKSEACLKPDIVAPGVDIRTINQYGEDTRSNGTSPACAVVSGIAALLIQAYPNASVQQVKQAIIDSSTPLDGLNKKRVRHGLIHPLKALDRLTQTKKIDSTTDILFNFDRPFRDPAFLSKLRTLQAHDTEKGILWFRQKEDIDEVMEDTKDDINFSVFKKRVFIDTNLLVVRSTVGHFKSLIRHPKVVYVSGVCEVN